VASNTLAGSRLRKLAQRRAAPPPAPEVGESSQAAEERCELCNERVAPGHRHVVDIASRQLMCACQACSILFDSKGTGGGHYRLVPNRRLMIGNLLMDEVAWQDLQIPVDMAFFFYSTPIGRVTAFYPGPVGATESQLELRSWPDIERHNPVLATLEHDVEALLVNRANGVRQHWLVPIDDCYALVGVFRTAWEGLSGGREVWQELDGFFEHLGRRARPATRDGEILRSITAANGHGG